MGILDLFSLKGKNALVTGSGQGLGAGMAIAFAQAGANVTLHNYDKVLDSTVEAVKKTGAAGVLPAGSGGIRVRSPDHVCDALRWLIRSAHAWAANLMLFAILVHMFSVFFMKAYRKPREIGWLSGMLLLVLAACFGFSGYLLPMDELSYFATKVGLQIPAVIPWIGPAIANMLRAGPDVSEFTVQRFFALHVVVLPALFIPLLAFHLWLVQRHGNAVPESEERKPASEQKSMSFFPSFLRKDIAMWIISLNVLALLASVFPWPLGRAYDALAPAPVGIHPEWYFMSPFEMLKMLGGVLPGELGEFAGLLLFTLGILLWVLIPFYDTSKESGRRGRLAHYFGLMAVFALLATTVIGYWAIR